MREMEEDRKNAISYDEYLKMKDEGLLPECNQATRMCQNYEATKQGVI